MYKLHEVVCAIANKLTKLNFAYPCKCHIKNKMQTIKNIVEAVLQC